MSVLIKNIEDLNSMVLNGKALEAFDKYYHNDVIMQENANPPRIGKATNRKHEEEFFGSITEFRAAKPLKVTGNENTTMVEWHFDYTHKDWGVRKYNQVAVQEWKDGLIVKESFYYGS